MLSSLVISRSATLASRSPIYTCKASSAARDRANVINLSALRAGESFAGLRHRGECSASELGTKASELGTKRGSPSAYRAFEEVMRETRVVTCY